ncbi:helix-hairpin-helix domain-containing protein [Clostridium tyrobutyricum]|uniref:helix-hairpin-helix domain-containing protein n=1 Tax=Clostridium tyrobutyricum TaxID=1519 RepID=UPI001C390F50|nr:helix-hairpin-helix domain-containing protein [Clostridium tyrobutyricum]MBV4439493.1 helix-hairpin-helix domain-containing protein [Clostridium tyrobutyricum]
MSIIHKINRFIAKCNESNYKKKIVGSCIILIVFIIFLIVGYTNSKPANVSSNEDIFRQEGVKNQKTQDNKSYGTITVYINGQVKNPGVYELKNDSRVEDLVKISGGFKDTADTYSLNLAKKLKDEDYIHVDEIKKDGDGKNNSNKDEKSGLSDNGTVNINKASKEELKSIPGVGDVTAENIIEYREQNGDFSSIEDIKNVNRIGDKTFEKLKDKIDVR